jgi:hypothetical protein
MTSAILPGTRIASVGIATFTVSLCVVLCLILLVIGRIMRRAWIGFVGVGLVLSVVLAFALTPKASDEETNNSILNELTLPSSLYSRSLYGTATFLILSVIGSALALAIVHSGGKHNHLFW